MFSSRNIHLAILGIILGASAGYVAAFYKANSALAPPPLSPNQSQNEMPANHPSVNNEQMLDAIVHVTGGKIEVFDPASASFAPGAGELTVPRRGLRSSPNVAHLSDWNSRRAVSVLPPVGRTRAEPRRPWRSPTKASR